MLCWIMIYYSDLKIVLKFISAYNVHISIVQPTYTLFRLPKTMPKKFIQYIEGQNIYVCKKCETHLTCLSQLVSKHYRSQHGSAFLFDTVVNVSLGPPYRKGMTSGYYIICDIFCRSCESPEPIGWKYVSAEQEEQRFKQGRFILSTSLLAKQNWTDDQN